MSAPTASPEEAGRPPQPPEIERRIAAYPHQVGYVAFLALFVGAALLGAFDDTQTTDRIEAPGLAVEVTYPTRFRYKQIAPIEVTLHNTSAQTLDTVRVRFDEAYLGGFSDVTFTPSFEAPWEVILTGVGPGARRLVSGEVQAEHYGRHEGTITVSAPGLRPVALDVATFTFP